MNKKARIILISTLAAIIAIPLLYLVIVYAQGYRRTAACDPILPKASEYMSTNTTSLKQIDGFRSLVNQIKTFKRYDKDPNCLDIMVTFYLNTGDLNNTQLYYAKLQAVYTEKTKFSGWLKPDIDEMGYLAGRIKLAEKNNEDAKKTLRTFPVNATN